MQDGRRAMLHHLRCCSLVPTNKTSSRDSRQGETQSASEEELRQRIQANAKVLFPSTGNSQHQSPDFEIVLASCPVCTASREVDTPAQYAMLVRRAPSGDYVPLLKGEAFSTAAPWVKTLQSLFIASARAIHLKFDGARLPAPEDVERLPRYESLRPAITQ